MTGAIPTRWNRRAWFRPLSAMSRKPSTARRPRPSACAPTARASTIHRKEAEAERLRADSAGIHDRLNGLFAEAKRIDLIRNRRAEARRHALQEAETAAQAEGFLSIWLDDQR